MILVDSSFLYATYNLRDSRHAEAAAADLQPRGSLIIPSIILPEVSFLFRRDLGYLGIQRLLRTLAATRPRLESMEIDDLRRMREIAQDYESARFDFVDCCIMAMSERLDITRVATFDRRDFTMFRPRHCAYLDLLP